MSERSTAPTERGVDHTIDSLAENLGSRTAEGMMAASSYRDLDGRALDDLADSYDILAELGRGGSAVVYRARDRRLLREVALKVVRLAPSLNERERTAEVARLAREARTVARLQHPNIVAVYAVHELRDGLAVSMQYVPGRTLKQAVAEDGAFAPDRAMQVMREVAIALAHAHAHGVVHRDVKPENIFVDDATGRALLADFGAAHAGDVDVRVTRTGATVGTPAYMSPEQIDGGTVDARADLYSLGLVAWEACTGRRPWEHAGLYQILHHQKHDALPPIACVRPAELPRVPLAVEYVIDRLLEKRAGARWASADALVAQLDHPVLPGDFKLWARTHHRRVADFVRNRGANGTGAVAALAAASTELLPLEKRGVGSGPSVPPRDDGTLAHTDASDLPSWAHGRPSRRWWYAGGLAAAVLAAIVPAITPRSRAPVAPSKSRLSTIALLPATPAGAPGSRGTSPTGATVIGEVPQPLVATSSGLQVTHGEVGPPLDPSTGPLGTAHTGSPHVSALPLGSSPAVGDTARRITVPTPAAASALPRRTRPPILVVPTAAAPAPLPVTRPPATPLAAPRAGGTAVTAERTVIAAGARHTCALDASGRALCWGANDSGQLGTGDLSAYDAPVSVTGDLRFVQIATGGAHSCGLTALGDAYCWGDDDHGQLGDAATSLRNAPVRVAGAWSYRTLRAGLDHTCALSTAATVVCWGDNARGQLGDGTTRGRATPATVAGVRAAAIAVGWRHSCALAVDGTALCWGDNTSGQLGDGTRTPRLSPVPVAASYRFITVAAGATHTCAVTTTGETYCWGMGGTDRAFHPIPVRVESPAPFATLAAGSVHTCGRTASGVVYCWGRNPYGQLGDGSTNDSWRPVRVPGGPFGTLSAAGAHTCAVADGAPVCWGYNVNGQLGDGTRTHHASPTRVARAVP